MAQFPKTAITLKKLISELEELRNDIGKDFASSTEFAKEKEFEQRTRGAKNRRMTSTLKSFLRSGEQN